MVDNVRSPTILEAGLAACVAANGSGASVGITHIALGSGRRVIAGNETALVNENYRSTISGAAKTSSTSWQIFSDFTFGATLFDCTEIGFFVGNTLFAYYSIAPTSSAKIFSASNITSTVDYTLDLSVVPVGSVTIVVDSSASVSNLILGNHIGAPDPHPQYVTDAEAKAIAWGVGQTSAPWAPLASPALTGTPTAPTAAVDTSTTQVATTAFVTAAGGSFLPKTGVGLTGALRAVGGLVNANNTLNVGVVGAVDNDTGLSWVSDGVLAIISNGVIRERINADTSAESFFGTGNAYSLSLQTDGNVVLRNPSSTVMWDAFATVRKVDFTGSYTANSGWRKYPDASSPTGFMIEQWGKTAALGIDATLAVTYPIPFPTAMCGSPFLVEVATATPRVDGSGVLSALNPGVNGFTLHKATDTAANAVAWRVWGY